MKAAVIVFPGSNCDRDLARAFTTANGRAPALVWHKDTSLPAGLDVIGIPGGFSFGDYLRCGAIAARAPIMQAVVDFANHGGRILGICNGFQVLTETGLLPGALCRNKGLKFICKDVEIAVETANTPFTSGYQKNQKISIPIAHHDGNYMADSDLLTRLRGDDRIAFSYCDNPNGSAGDIAGIVSKNRRVLGLMPHPERRIDLAQGGCDGAPLFCALAGAMLAA